ncbi:leukocyte surface antigen CD47 [Fukomys damarensis]|uniref:leukocyte surface antigen CD47 n=1 Tax=Fukomys damarensis TaxID=885580 RepID=UPI000540290A|nr:leukocyte surface antigen CD47 [Fukomys damarensis]
MGARKFHSLGSAQLLFKNIKSVYYNNCNETVTLPCHVNNIQSDDTRELFVKWKFKGKIIFTFDGPRNKSIPDSGFSTAKINIQELLKGDGSLQMDKADAKLGNYTCEITELTREGETVVELKYHSEYKTEDEHRIIVSRSLGDLRAAWKG